MDEPVNLTPSQMQVIGSMVTPDFPGGCQLSVANVGPTDGIFRTVAVAQGGATSDKTTLIAPDGQINFFETRR